MYGMNLMYGHGEGPWPRWMGGPGRMGGFGMGPRAWAGRGGGPMGRHSAGFGSMGGRGMGCGPEGMGHRGGARRYLEPSLLLLLKDKPAHGYELMERVGEIFPRASALPDVSTLYRVLARLEADGAVSSRWEDGEGAGRKVYSLTEQGREVLAAWVATFRDEHQRLGRFLEKYQGRAPEERKD